VNILLPSLVRIKWANDSLETGYIQPEGKGADSGHPHPTLSRNHRLLYYQATEGGRGSFVVRCSLDTLFVSRGKYPTKPHFLDTKSVSRLQKTFTFTGTFKSLLSIPDIIGHKHFIQLPSNADKSRTL